MNAEDDRDALLFEPSNSQSLSELKATSASWQSVFAGSRHSSGSPRISLPAPPQSPTATEPVQEKGVQLHRHRAEPTCIQRHVTLFASVDVEPPTGCLPKQPAASSRIPVAEQFYKPLLVPQSHCRPRLPDAFPAEIKNATHFPAACSASCAQPVTLGSEGPPRLFSYRLQNKSAERPDLSPAPLPDQPSCQCRPVTCTCRATSNPREFPTSVKGVDGTVAHDCLRHVEAQSLVAEELKEINRMMEERANRLKQQEEGVAASVTAARNALRRHAQRLLEEAAEKLTRAAAQQRRRTEIAADEATAVLRRAAEAQRVLRHEKRMLEQLQKERRDEQQLRLAAAMEALEAERRQCVALKIRLQALQRENRQLRASARAEPFQSRVANEARKNATESSSVTGQRRCSSFRPLIGACRALRVCPTRATALAKAAVHTAAPSGQPACGASFEGRRPGLAGRPAVVDVHVRLPPVDPSVALPPLPCGHAYKENHCAPLERLKDQQSKSLVDCEAEATEHTAVALNGDKYTARSARSPSNSRQQTKLMSAGSTACRTGHSTTSGDSIRSSKAGTTRRRLERVARKIIGERSRSASHGSLSTSTSSSSPSPLRQVARLRGRSLSSRRANNAKHQRISLSIAEADFRRLLQDKEIKPVSLKSSQRAARGGHKLALREDVAGRLQASLRRLQERQMLHTEMRVFAKQL